MFVRRMKGELWAAGSAALATGGEGQRSKKADREDACVRDDYVEGQWLCALMGVPKGVSPKVPYPALGLSRGICCPWGGRSAIRLHVNEPGQRPCTISGSPRQLALAESSPLDSLIGRAGQSLFGSQPWLYIRIT